MSKDDEGPLLSLARAWGIAWRYVDGLGEAREASEDAVLAVLVALGAPIARAADVPDALAARGRDLVADPIAPVTVAWGGLAAIVTVRVSAWASGPFVLRGRHESGERWALHGRVDDLPVEREDDVDGARTTVRRIVVAGPLAIGAHDLEFEHGGHTHEALLLCAPAQAFDGDGAPPAWGLFAPAYAIRDDARGDAWDLTALGSLAERAGRAGARWLGTLPLFATFLDAPFSPSPYAPASRLFWNEAYLDLAACPEMRASRAARARWKAVAGAERDGNAERYLDWAAAWQRRRPVLDALADACFASEARRGAIDAFAAAHPRLPDYARFRAATERRGAGWPSWDGAARDGTLADAEVDPAVERRHLYAQLVMHEQLDALGTRARDAGVSLYLDLPIGVHPDSYDTWRQRASFVLGASSGAPPDALFTGGQCWGAPPVHPERERRAGYRYVREVLRTLASRAGALRLDHVLGLHRAFVVPNGFGATDGVYVRQRADELYALVAIESARARARIVGEDLGTVPPDVRPAMARRAFARIGVGQFGMSGDPDAPIAPPPAGSFASLSTHDMPPFAAFAAALDVGDMLSLGLLDEAGAVRAREGRAAAIAALAARYVEDGRLAADDARDPVLLAREATLDLAWSAAAVVLMSVDDLWGETGSHNVPGTHDERPNWRLRHAEPLSALDTGAPAETLARLARQRPA